MNNIKRTGFIVLSCIAVVVLLFVELILNDNSIKSVAEIYHSNEGGSVVATYEDGEIIITHLNTSGSVSTFTIPRTEDGGYVSILDMLLDDEGYLYILKEILNEEEKPKQSIEVYNLENLFFKHTATHELLSDEIYYKWLSLDGSIFLSGTTEQDSKVIRSSYDAGQLRADNITEPKHSRTYNISSEEGIHELAPYGDDIIFMAKSGKLFMASEGEPAPTEIYPARSLERVMYPIFFTIQDDIVLLGEQESGDILSLIPSTGETDILKSGTEPFSGESSYTPINILSMSMVDTDNFLAVTKNEATRSYDLLHTVSGQTTEINTLSRGFIATLLTLVFRILIAVGIIFVAINGISAYINYVKNNKSVLNKLTLTVLPVLLAALILFGVFAYYSNRLTVIQNTEKQIQDEGNLLAALFGAEVFDEMEFPYDYVSDSYKYLLAQIGTRATYTRTAYFERETLYTGVDFDAPLFYPFEIGMSIDSAELYARAAGTGTAQTGMINDKYGIRFSCVTPIGGISGATTYLIETGVPYSGIDESSLIFLLIYIGFAAVFVLVMMLLLNATFKRLINPIGRIKSGLEEFSKGDTTVRIEFDSNDELSDIVKVFNNMASDIDLRMYDLQKASQTYFRFIPQKVFALLGKESLADIKLGNSVEAIYNTLTVSLSFNNSASTATLQEMTNRCFNIINETCDKYNATPVADSVNLRRLQIICPEGANSAVDVALGALSRIDALNAGVPMQNKVSALFIVHKTRVFYGICGDENRYVPSIISSELDFIAENEELFREFSTRLIVTSASVEEIEEDSYFYRNIGQISTRGNRQYELYDFYDASPGAQTQLINETKATFDKAMQLYNDKRYYEAKNLFAIVLRENQYDNVARYYIFKCERSI